MDFCRLILKRASTFLFVFSLFFSLSLRGEGLPRKAVNLKTLKVDLPTEYGPLLTEIHFDDQNHDLALRVEEIIRKDLLFAINYFQFMPKEIVHFNIDPYLLLNNGFATVFPQSVIHLFNHPPVQRDHLIVMDDWLRGLIFHEFVHIVHLTQTRDYLKVGQNIFGTIAKVPAGLVPRWFTEGVAVWAESFLIGPGRLQNRTFSNEIKSYLKKNTSCQTIDCLDEPGDYPGGQLAYWAGGHFLDFLERKKSGTVKCLVEYNSSSIPFFLNNAFLECTGEKAQVLFYKFREQLLSENFKPENAKEVPPYFGKIIFKKAWFFMLGKFLKLRKKEEWKHW